MIFLTRLRAALAAWDVMLLLVLSLLLHYEGVPPVRDFPLVGRAIGYLPIVGDLVDGEIARRIERATAGMVSETENSALQAQLDEERRRRLASDQAMTEARNRALASERAEEADRAGHDVHVSADKETRPRNRAILTEEDILWLDGH
ncbi:hypothetical protein J5N58_07060 [Rhizobium cremeum]|uniref:hypothetical protein n=1 Tax=Rhizobium cremeum TaxID=2813827 RepID=UPI001FD2A8CE|nr:hypothetical protein [Rhizobium cremeum]MCJ7996711.1 hypothetical protein [Rhizobium cremeum]MCJ7999435.1 hypothetical protein [Rhizobium cremeum]